MSILLTAQELEKSFGEKLLFENLSFVISQGERVGLIGPNGAGKSTLLKLIAGEEAADSGELIPVRGLRLGYLNQVPSFVSSHTVKEALSQTFSDLEVWEQDQKLDEYFWRYGLDSTELSYDRKVDELSGGWRKRLAILRELIKEPDLLLMDEPTNHLDIEGIYWLEQLMDSSESAFVTITHDRYFLDKVANRILELDQRNEGGILSVEGNYSRYLHVKESIMEAQENRETVLRGVLRRETEWLKAGVKARTTKQQARIQRHGDLADDVAKLSKRNIKRKIDVQFQSSDEKPKRLIEAKNISKSYDDQEALFEQLDVLLTPGSRLGIMGENGCGKSSLIKVLLQEEKPDQGKVFHSDLLEVAYFEQGKEEIDGDLSLIQSVCPAGDQVFYRGKPLHVRSYLGRFLFENEKMDMPVSFLSGGEQSRLLLAKLMLIEANVLVLDEPTNDLDIATLNVLEDCLKEFNGAVLLVTHDRFFLDRVSTQLLAFPPHSSSQEERGLRYFESFAQWENWHQSFDQKGLAPTKSSKRSSKQKQKKGKNPERSQAALMKTIEKAEAKYKALEEECAKPEVSSDFEKLSKNGEKMKALQSEIAKLYEDWAALED